MEWLSGIISAALTITVVWAFIKPVLKLGEECRQCLSAVLEAMEDRKLSPEEIKKIWNEARDVRQAADNLWSKIRERSRK